LITRCSCDTVIVQKGERHVSSVSERTQKEIMDYIRIHSMNGKLTKSLLDIAKDIGYSNATVHRALRILQNNGDIEVIPHAKPTEANTIIYKGSVNEMDEFLAKGVKLAEDMSNLGEQMNDFMQEASWFIRKLHHAAEKNSLQGEVVQVQDIPQSDLQIVTIRK
jgi:hypothetical protein